MRRFVNWATRWLAAAWLVSVPLHARAVVGPVTVSLQAGAVTVSKLSPGGGGIGGWQAEGWAFEMSWHKQPLIWLPDGLRAPRYESVTAPLWMPGAIVLILSVVTRNRSRLADAIRGSGPTAGQPQKRGARGLVRGATQIVGWSAVGILVAAMGATRVWALRWEGDRVFKAPGGLMLCGNGIARGPNAAFELWRGTIWIQRQEIESIGPNPTAGWHIARAAADPYRERSFWPQCSIVNGFGEVEMPLWLLAVIVALPLGVSTWRRRGRVPAGHCATCGYDLTGNLSGRCPECGIETAESL